MLPESAETKMDRALGNMRIRNYSMTIVVLCIFYAIAFTLWYTTGSLFYLLNFILIGTSIGLGIGLWPVLAKNKRDRARCLSQVLVGGYMFLGLGFGFIYVLARASSFLAREFRPLWIQTCANFTLDSRTENVANLLPGLSTTVMSS